MISPYKGRFTITQAYKGSAHDGFDMYGVDSKNIYSTVTGTVTHAGWEDAGNPSKGFGLYVSILRDGTDQKYYFGHLSQICSNVYEGARVYYGQQIGVEGSTGNSTGSHCHYACRSASDSRTPYNISSISGIPNVESGTFYSDNPGVVSGFDGSGSSTPSSITQQYMVNGFWNDLRGSLRTTMHGIKLPTAGKPYYLYYRTYNTGHGWYPFVTSEENDYAGSPGKNIEALECHVYSSSGVKLHNQYVIMYRAFANGTWLPWVSNAPKETMIFLQNKYSLAGDLDVYSCDAGLPGSGIPIEGLDFRIYENVYGSGEGGGDVSGTGGSDGLTKKFMQNGTWKELKNTTWVTSMDGVELKTNETDFYLKYQTYNAIYNGWYPWVTSEENDYAGSSGKPIQAIDIRVCDRNGNHMHDTHAVMYRAHVNGRWLPWVSNASPDIMRRLQSQYNLGGELDTGSAYAGIYGETINQLEIRLYKNVGTSSGSSGSGSSGATAPSGGGGTKIYIDAGHGGQYPGACGGGYQEKDLTLQIALAERRYFMALGYNVMLCRDDDTTSELAERSGAANAWPADIFISNHLNSFDRTARGCEVYHALSGGASKVYAEAVQRALVNQIGFIDRGAKSLCGDDGRDYYHVIRETNMPAIMIESGFIDNDQDRTLIVNNIDKIAKAVVDAIHSANPNPPTSSSTPSSPTNNYFNIANKNKLYDELEKQVSYDFTIFEEIKARYSTLQALDIVLSKDKLITDICNKLKFPKAIYQTILFRELRCVWIQDDFADALVMASYSYDDALERWSNLSPAQQLITPAPTMPLGYRHDSSTGLGQIFAKTAIAAHNFAVLSKIISDRLYNYSNYNDKKTMWFNLKDNDEFNLKYILYVLVYEASNLAYNNSYFTYTENQIQKLLTKYNGTGDSANEYGRECFGWYAIFNKYK